LKKRDHACVKSASVSTLESEPLKVLGWAEHGEEVVVLREGVPVARMLPIVRAMSDASDKPKTPEEIEQYLLLKPSPQGKRSAITGAELVSLGRGEI